jgi:polyhydroxyalkanoate synthase
MVRVLNAAKGGAEAAQLLHGATPHSVVWSSGPATLRHYAPQVETTATPLLLVTPIINRYRIVDLKPGGSLVESLVARGIPVYVTDWGAPRRIDADTDWETYVLRWLPQMAELAAAAHGGPRVDVLGYCLGGTLSVMFAARFPQLIRRLATLAAPVDFHVDEAHMDVMREWVNPACFPVERLTRAFGNMPGRLVLQGFLWHKPFDTLLKPYNAWKRFDELGFAQLFGALESWNQDNVDIPGATYRRLIQDLYRDNLLAKGEFTLRGQAVDLSQIEAPLLVITMHKDTTCPPASALALLERVSSERRERLDLKGGHVTPVVSGSGRARLHDPLADWLLAD